MDSSTGKSRLDDLRIDRSGEGERTRSSGRASATLAWAVAFVALIAVAVLGWKLRSTSASAKALSVPPASTSATSVATDSPATTVPTPEVPMTQAAKSQRILLNASGYVVARREATVSSKVTGKVLEVFVEEGARVKDGQILARLDASNVEANLRLAQAQVAVAEAVLSETRVLLEEAQTSLRRVSGLARDRIASEAELDRARAEAQSFEARLAKQQIEIGVARSQAAVWQQQLDDSIIRAPFEGVVTSKNAQPGEMISPMSAGGGFTRTGICTIVDMNSLEIEIDVNESYINRVEAGQSVEATLDAYPEWKIPCRVIAIIPTADRQKATVKVRVGFEKLDSRMLPQMGVKVAFKDHKPA